MAGLFINVDFCNLFADFQLKPGECSVSVPMNEDGLRQEIDYYSVPGVSAIIFNLNAMRAYFDSRAWEPIWEGLEERPDHTFYYRGKKLGMEFGHSQLQMALRCRELYRNVPDPQKFRYDYCRKKGVKMYVSMRMNDVHWTADPDLITHCSFWREHPEFQRAFFRKDHSFWFAHCFDYACPEVYDHHLALVREYFDRFEMDGFELDWMRSPFCFRPGGASAGRTVLNRFMADVRAIARAAERRRGHEIPIAVRVHSRPDEALEAGFDVLSWARDGLVDCVVPTPYFQSSDASLPVEFWRRLLPETVMLAPGLECHLNSGYASIPANPELDAGFASSYYEQGADAVYLFNHMLRYTGYCGLDVDEQRKSFPILSDRKTADAAARRHAATMHESIVEGRRGVPAFPPEILPGKSMPVLIHAGGGTAHRSAKVILGFTASADPSSLKVFLNGSECVCMDSAAGCLLPEALRSSLVYRVPDHVLHDGLNQIDAVNTGAKPIPLAWAEIMIPDSADRGN